MDETMGDIIRRVWMGKWKELPIDRRINLRHNYSRTIENRIKRGKHGTIDAKQQTKKD